MLDKTKKDDVAENTESPETDNPEPSVAVPLTVRVRKITRTVLTRHGDGSVLPDEADITQEEFDLWSSLGFVHRVD